eukprot:1347490-Amorphochlora_amoeboformis.AAC.1
MGISITTTHLTTIKPSLASALSKIDTLGLRPSLHQIGSQPVSRTGRHVSSALDSLFPETRVPEWETRVLSAWIPCFQGHVSGHVWRASMKAQRL